MACGGAAVGKDVPRSADCLGAVPHAPLSGMLSRVGAEEMGKTTESAYQVVGEVE